MSHTLFRAGLVRAGLFHGTPDVATGGYAGTARGERPAFKANYNASC
jgi:hypothetical protein